MNDEELQSLVQNISEDSFGWPFRHTARFNSRLRTTGGRYLLRSHDIECNPHLLNKHGIEALVSTIKHELCHYHLHLQGRGYRHGDHDFRELLDKVGGSRFCKDTGLRSQSRRRYRYVCVTCGVEFHRKRRIDTNKFLCGKCHGRLKLIEAFQEI